MYNSILGLIFFLRFASVRNVERSKTFYWFVLVFLFIFSAFRFRVGCDWFGYLANFRGASAYTYLEALEFREPAWWFILIFFKNVSFPYPFINVFTSAIFFIGVHYLARRQPDRLSFLVLLFPILIINMPMSGIRQAVAIGFFCVAISCFVMKKPYRFVLCILLGGAFHSSLMIFLPLFPFVVRIRKSQQILLASLVLIPSLIILYQSDSGQVAVDRYISSGTEAFGAIFRVGLLTLTGILFFTNLKEKWRKQYPEDLVLVSIGAFLMIILLPLTFLSTVIADRLGYYLIPLQAMILSRIPFMNFVRSREVYSVFTYIILAIVFFVWSSISKHFNICYIPYDTWIFGNGNFWVDA